VGKNFHTLKKWGLLSRSIEFFCQLCHIDERSASFFSCHVVFSLTMPKGIGKPIGDNLKEVKTTLTFNYSTDLLEKIYEYKIVFSCKRL